MIHCVRPDEHCVWGGGGSGGCNSSGSGGCAGGGGCVAACDINGAHFKTLNILLPFL